MIQRIQSLFLLLASVSAFLLLYFPIWTAKVSFFIYEAEVVTFSAHDEFWLQVLAGVIGGLSFISIFLFKKRILQIWMGWLNIIFIITFYCVVYFVSKKFDIPMAREVATLILKPGSYLPLITLFFTVIANFFIWKDEKTVRSLDRLR